MTIPEQWLAIPGWDAYEVSSLGRVRRVKPAKGATIGAIIRPVDRKGYLRVVLRQDHRSRQVDIQILVAEAFIGPRPSPLHQAAHLNGNSAECALPNIEWKTITGNDADKDAHGTRPRGESHARAILTEAAVRDIRSQPRSPRVAVDLAHKYSVAPATIRNVRCGRKWAHVIMDGEPK